MMDPSDILQYKLYERLSTVNYNNTLVPVVDDEQDVEPPFINFISDTMVDDSCKNDYGVDKTITLEVVTDYRGNRVANEISNEVLQKLITDSGLYPDLSPDFHLYHIQLDFAGNTSEDTETSRLYKKILRFRFLIEEL